MERRPPRRARPRAAHALRGSATIVALLLVVLLGGLSVGLLVETQAGRQVLDRHDHNERALQIAEAGLVMAGLEVRSGQDSAADGVGNLTRTYGGGAVSVTAVESVATPGTFVLTARATHGLSTRTIVSGIRRRPAGPFRWAAFGRDGVTVSASPTDAYDSRLGAYAAQAVNADARGPFALQGGSVGSNRQVTLSGSTRIRGDASSGPGYATSGTATMVVGSRASLTEPVDLPYTPRSEFEAAMVSPSNGTWSGSGGSLTYNAARRQLTMSGGGTLTLPAGTYFLTDITLSGGSTLRITGPVKLYATGRVNFSGGSVMNVSGRPADFQIYNHPYTTLVAGYTPGTTSVTISGGGTGAAMVSYGPESPLTFSGGGNVYGSYIARTVTNSGGSFLHYDKALADLGGADAGLEQLYWLEPSPPRR